MMLLKLVVGFAAFLLIVILIELFRRKYAFSNEREKEYIPGSGGEEAGFCCGKHENCEKLKILATKRNKSQNIEYYDDDELDAYKGKTSDTYTPEEIEIFKEIRNTMLSEDISGWMCSLKLRGIELPDQLKTKN